MFKAVTAHTHVHSDGGGGGGRDKRRRGTHRALAVTVAVVVETDNIVGACATIRVVALSSLAGCRRRCSGDRDRPGVGDLYANAIIKVVIDDEHDVVIITCWEEGDEVRRDSCL